MTHMYFSARAEGRISYGHLGRTNTCFIHFCFAFSLSLQPGPEQAEVLNSVGEAVEAVTIIGSNTDNNINSPSHQGAGLVKLMFNMCL